MSNVTISEGVTASGLDFDAISEYCSIQDIHDRLTSRGFTYYVDRGQDGVDDDDEISAHVVTGIRWAGNMIDAFVPVNGTLARAQQVPILRDLAIDLATYRVVTLCGDEATTALENAFQDAIKMMERFSKGLAVPGLTIPAPYNSGRVPGGARAVNVR